MDVFVLILYMPSDYSLVGICEAFVINDFCLEIKKENVMIAESCMQHL